MNDKTFRHIFQLKICLLQVHEWLNEMKYVYVYYAVHKILHLNFYYSIRLTLNSAQKMDVQRPYCKNCSLSTSFICWMCTFLTIYIICCQLFFNCDTSIYVSEMEKIKSHKKSNAQSYEPLSRYNVCSNTHANIHMNWSLMLERGWLMLSEIPSFRWETCGCEE